MKLFGEILREKREQMGYSQRKLAKELGVAGMTVSQWETGKSYPNLMTACDIADALHCTLDELVDRRVNV